MELGNSGTVLFNILFIEIVLRNTHDTIKDIIGPMIARDCKNILPYFLVNLANLIINKKKTSPGRNPKLIYFNIGTCRENIPNSMLMKVIIARIAMISSRTL